MSVQNHLLRVRRQVQLSKNKAQMKQLVIKWIALELIKIVDDRVIQ